MEVLECLPDIKRTQMKNGIRVSNITNTPLTLF